jgi:hypothetical protein
MKIIITESQYKVLLESNNSSMQNLIDMAFQEMKQNCEEEKYFDTMVCDGVEIVEEIKVVDVQKTTSKSERNGFVTSFLLITIDCYIDYFKPYFDLDSLIDELEFEARHIVGGRLVKINLRNIINKRKEFNY